jgi:pyruvate dehydrogenase E2 component (dihydrolipoamide acetyltransferase)
VPDHVERIGFGERWLRNGLEACDPPGAFATIEVDMERARAQVEGGSVGAERVTFVHIVVRAVALTLARHPELHVLVAGNHRLRPGRVDIGLSVAGSSFLSPVMVIEDADHKSAGDIAREVRTRIPQVKEDDERMIRTVRRWGWILPIAFLRRAVLRFLLRRLWFRRKGVGTFQISCLSHLDVVVPFLFSTTAILGVGGVRPRVVARDGQPAVRTTVHLSLCVDHRVWDGIQAMRFLTGLKRILEREDLGT